MVGFGHPKNRSKSEIIYSELLPKGQIIKEGIGNQEISEESDINFENDYEKKTVRKSTCITLQSYSEAL